MKKEYKITMDDVVLEQRVLDVAGESDNDIIKEAEVKFSKFLDSINKHISELKEEDYELYVIGAAQNVEQLNSSVEESLKLIAVADALEELEKDEKFRLFIDSYVVERPKALTTVLTARVPLSFEVRSLTEQSLSAVGFFQEYIHTVSVQKSNKSELVKDSISLSLYKRSIEIVNSLIADREKKGK